VGGNWPGNKEGVKGCWAIYNEDETAAADWIAQCRLCVLEEVLSSDGVFMEGPNYAGCRLGTSTDRGPSKGNFMDVCEFTGKSGFYDEPILQNSYEWLYAGGSNRVKR